MNKLKQLVNVLKNIERVDRNVTLLSKYYAELCDRIELLEMLDEELVKKFNDLRELESEVTEMKETIEKLKNKAGVV